MNALSLAFIFSYSLAYLWLLFSERERSTGFYGLFISFLQAALPFGGWIFLATPLHQALVLVWAGVLALLKWKSRWLSSPPPLRGFLFVQIIALALGIGLNRIPGGSVTASHFQHCLNWWAGLLHLPASHLQKFLLHGVGLLWLLWGGTAFVRSVLQPFATTRKSIPREEWQRGKVIGNLERLLIYFLVQMNLPAMVTLIVGLKAIARFKQLEEREFAEYFLIGTLASLLFALVLAFGVQMAVARLS